MNDYRLELSTDLCITLQLIQELAVLQMAVCSALLSPRKAIVDIINFVLFSFKFTKILSVFSGLESRKNP